MPELPTLPDAYEHFLLGHDGTVSYIFDDCDGWTLDTKEDLLTTVQIDRRETASIFQLQSITETLREVGADEVEDQDEEPYSLERLAAGLAIGTNNGDVMFLDPSDGYSVWVYYHDGSDVERLADDFPSWLAEAEMDEDDLDDEEED